MDVEALVPLQFRPTVVIFVGPTGDIGGGQGAGGGAGGAVQRPLASVYEHFSDLCARLNPVLHRGIGVLTIGEGSNDATIYPLGTPPAASVSRSGDFLTLMNELLHDIRGFRSCSEIEDAGYPVLEKRPQVYIVGRTDSTWVSEVAKRVNALLGAERAFALVSYELIEEPASAVQAAPFPPPQPPVMPQWARDLLPQGGSLPLVNFCHVYEEMGQPLLYMSQPDLRYAVAEALFGCLATGMTAAAPFKAATALGLTTVDADTRIGSIGTSLITFPRGPAERYCADMHGVELVNNWISAMQRRGLDLDQQEELTRQMREQAREDAQRICDDLSDNEPRPGFAERDWPGLPFLEDVYLAQQLAEATESVFQNFINLKQWSVDRKRRETQAIQAFRSWKDTAEGIWVEGGRLQEQAVGEKVDAIWLQNEQGISAARTYIKQLDMLLGQVRDRFMDWRVKHRETYEEALQKLSERADGPWVIRQGASNLVSGQTAGPAQATPSAAAVPPSPTGTGGVPPTLNSPPSAAPPTSPAPQQPSQRGGLPNREKEVADNLAARVKWMRERIPTLANLAGVGVMATILLVFLLLTLLPDAWLASPPLAALCTAVGVGLSAAGSWLYRNHSRRRVREAEEDLLRAYRLYFAYECEWWEDQLRIVVLSPLIGRVRRMRAQLENFEEYLETIAQVLRAAATRTENELFDSPGGYRDVFIGNREILSRHGYRLENFNQTLVHLRQTQPKETWHQTPGKVHEQLRKFFAERGISIVGLQQDVLIQHIREFTHSLVAPYLQGDTVEIAAALEAVGDRGELIIEKAVENSRVLYRPYHNIPELSYYICGRDEQRSALPEKAVPARAIMVRGSDREWMLLACFWTGGARTRWGTSSSGLSPLAARLPPAPTW